MLTDNLPIDIQHIFTPDVEYDKPPKKIQPKIEQKLTKSSAIENPEREALFDLPLKIEPKQASQMELKLHALKVQEQAKMFEQQLEEREDLYHLREQAFHLLETVCPTTPSALPASVVEIVDSYFFHSKMLYLGQHAQLKEIKEAQFGGFYRVSDTEAYAFLVVGRKLQVWNIYGHEYGISIETS